ncbi:P-loop containing nucleoside triphosphate hydrolase [Gracilaria domingensis]|nr:P-loop containing nucleoside triphosphate hydrolase [Gracilaria domingensis]
MENKVIMLGNPGCGKSTLLNTALGAVYFDSGTSVGHGILPSREEVRDGPTTYVDTPGLDDPGLRQQAAQYISNQLSNEGIVKLVFVMKCDDLRIRGSDQAALKMVLDALKDRGIDCNMRFSIIINQLFDYEIDTIRQDPAVQTKILSFINGGYKVRHVGWLPMEAGAKGKSGALLSCRERILAFFDAAPYITMPRGVQVNIKHERFEEMRSQMSNVIRGLQNDVNKQNQLLQERDSMLVKVKDETRHQLQNLKEESLMLLRNMEMQMQRSRRQMLQRQHEEKKMADTFEKEARNPVGSLPSKGRKRAIFAGACTGSAAGAIIGKVIANLGNGYLL